MWITQKWQQFTSALDKGGLPAWVAVTALGFMIFWPIGLILLFSLIGRRTKMNNCRHRQHYRYGATGNTAFDRYRQETLERLEREKLEFQAFLQRLREAKDQENFDNFMKEYQAPAKGEKPQSA